MAILTDGVGCGSPGGKWPCYPAVFCIPMLCSVFLCCVLFSYVVFCSPILCSVFCIPMLCSVYSDLLSVRNCGGNCFQPWCVDVCGWGVQN